MKVFVAGASGAVGIPIVKELLKQGHQVTAMSRSGAGSQKLTALGVEVLSIDAFDQKQMSEALQRSSPHTVIDMLTSLPKNPANLGKASPQDRKLRLEGGGHLFAAAGAAGATRYLQQSCGFWIKPKGEGLGTEEDPFQLDATPNISTGSQMYRLLEERVFSNERIEGVALRYGFFYGPGTWYTQDGGAADLVRQQHLPIVGKGCGVNSFIHIDDAAIATVATLEAEPGVYNIVDDDPLTVATWLPAFAQAVGAPPPAQVSEEAGLAAAGPDAFFYHNGLSGASNAKAKRTLGFRPRPLEWLQKEKIGQGG